MTQDYFFACPFVDDDDAENPISSWKNYGGIYYDDGTDHGWIEDSYGLTQQEAENLAKILNQTVEQTFWFLPMEKINDIIKTFIHTHRGIEQ